MFSQPNIQPAPAIQNATAKANTMRNAVMEEKRLIRLNSLNRQPATVEVKTSKQQAKGNSNDLQKFDCHHAKICAFRRVNFPDVDPRSVGIAERHERLEVLANTCRRC